MRILLLTCARPQCENVAAEIEMVGPDVNTSGDMSQPPQA